MTTTLNPLAADVVALYERCGQPATTEAEIRETCGQLAGLSKAELLALCEALELYGANRWAKGRTVEAITARLLDRKGTAIRRTLLDRK